MNAVTPKEMDCCRTMRDLEAFFAAKQIADADERLKELAEIADQVAKEREHWINELRSFGREHDGSLCFCDVPEGAKRHSKACVIAKRRLAATGSDLTE